MITGIGVHIKVKDFQRSLQFYQNLGFSAVFEYGPDKQVKETYNGIVFEHGGSKLEIADGHRAVKPEVFQETVASSKISLMIDVEDLTAIVAKCHQHNIAIATPPRHYYWGKLELVILDPDGTRLVFTTPYSPNQAKALKADETWAQAST